MGPLCLLDLIGLDTAYEILDTMYRQGRNRLHAPSPILKQMVTAGLLGRKTGRGFYTYEAPDSPVVVDDAETPDSADAPQLRREIARVGVVGSGTMATGIVEVFAKAGYDVTYVTRSPDKVDLVREGVGRSLEKAVQRGKLTADDRDAALGHLSRQHRYRGVVDRRSGRRGDRRGSGGQEGLVREPRRDLSRRRDPRHHHVLVAGDRTRLGDAEAA